MDKIKKIIRSIRNLPQYKNLSEEELIKIAQQQAENKELVETLSFCLDDEKKFAKKLLENYLAERSFENFSERDTLMQLIGIEVLAERIKKFLKTEGEKANPSIPLQMVEQLTTINKQSMELKDKLGLTRKENTNTLDEWETLKKKALTYYQENKGCNVAKCPYCQKMFMILKDMRGHHEEKLPIFKRTVLYNKELYEPYEKGIITKEKLASIQGVHPDYVEYIFENIYKNEK